MIDEGIGSRMIGYGVSIDMILYLPAIYTRLPHSEYFGNRSVFSSGQEDMHKQATMKICTLMADGMIL
jgi:hypothetical protein